MPVRTRFVGILLFFAASTVACSSSSPTPAGPASSDTGTPAEDTGDPGDTLVADAAPDAEEGPCGVKVGDTLCDATDLEGYFRTDTSGLATTATFGPSPRLRDVLSKGTTEKYGFIYLSAWW